MQKIDSLKDLEKKAYEMRMEVVKMLNEAGSGHTGGPLGIADIMTFLYFNYMKHDPENPESKDHDFFLMSNGHVCPIWYAVLAHSGYFPIEDLKTLRKLDSHLQGHPKNTMTPGVFNSSGLLGQGLVQATGVALGLKLDGKPNRVYCLTSDGEQQEGAVWENILNASKFKLNNLTLIMDWNGIQIEGTIEDIMPSMPDPKDIYEKAGWNVVEIDGNDFEEIKQAFEATEPNETDRPNLIIAKTIPGKGVDFMENKWEWHDWKGDDKMTKEALAQLEQHV